MKQSLPYLSALAAVILSAGALANPTPEPSTAALPASDTAPGVATPTTLPAIENASSGGTPAQSVEANASQSVLGDRLLLQIANQLDRRVSVTAKIRHSVLISGQQLFGVGSYWQHGNGEDLKVRLELQIAGQEAQLLQVFNSRFMWIDRKLPTGRYVTRTDIRPLRTDPSLSSAGLNDMKPGEASWSTLQSELTPYTGGLPKLLMALANNFTFLPPQAMRLAIEPPLATDPTNLPVFAIVGHWKPESLANVLGRPAPNSTDPASPSPLRDQGPITPVPERIPEEVLILVGQSDLFPYRIEYRRRETPHIVTSEGAPIPYQLSVRPLVVLELSDVVFDGQISPGLFDYTPGDADWFDQTTVILEKLRHQRQARVATRPAADDAAVSRQ